MNTREKIIRKKYSASLNKNHKFSAFPCIFLFICIRLGIWLFIIFLLFYWKTNGCFCLTSFGAIIIYRVGVRGRLRGFGEDPVVLSSSNEGKLWVTQWEGVLYIKAHRRRKILKWSIPLCFSWKWKKLHFHLIKGWYTSCHDVPQILRLPNT